MTTSNDPRIEYAVKAASLLTERGYDASALVCGGEAVDDWVTEPDHQPDADQSVGLSLVAAGVDILVTSPDVIEPDRNWGLAAWDDEVSTAEVTVDEIVDRLRDWQ